MAEEKGKTAAAADADTIAVEVDGVPVSIDRASLANDIDTLELLADIDDGDVLSVVRLMRHVFGDEQYRNIKKSLRRDGRTTVSDMNDFMAEVFKAIGDDSKN